MQPSARLALLCGLLACASTGAPMPPTPAAPAEVAVARLIFAAPPNAIAEIVPLVERRLSAYGIAGARVLAKKRRFVIELGDDQLRRPVTDLVGRACKLQFAFVEENSALLQRLVADGDGRAKALELHAEHDTWGGRMGLPVHTDIFVMGSREHLTQYLATLPPDDRPDRDHLLVIARNPASDEGEAWRTYYLDRRQSLAVMRVQGARAMAAAYGRFHIDLALLAEDGSRLNALTGANVGGKMAILVDDEVVSVPVVMTAIPGRAILDAGLDEERTRMLAACLSGGALPVAPRLVPDADE
jgi:preprotein translocase subunit SecD